MVYLPTSREHASCQGHIYRYIARDGIYNLYISIYAIPCLFCLMRIFFFQNKRNSFWEMDKYRETFLMGTGQPRLGLGEQACGSEAGPLVLGLSILEKF